MGKFVVEINFHSYRNRIGMLVEAKDDEEARNIAQRHFFKTHPNDSILSSSVVKIDVTLIDTNPSNRKSEEKA